MEPVVHAGSVGATCYEIQLRTTTIKKSGYPFRQPLT